MFFQNHRITDETRKVQKEADKAAFRSVGHAAASTRKDALASIKDAPKSGAGRDESTGRFLKGKRDDSGSPPGTPPYTRKGKRGRRIKRAILYAVDKQRKTAVVGTARSRFGTAGEPHEHGGNYKGESFDRRPFMFPAMERQAPRFAGSFAGSIGD